MAPGFPGLYNLQRSFVECGETGRIVGAYDDTVLIGDDQVPPYEGTRRFGELYGKVKEYAYLLSFRSRPLGVGFGAFLEVLCKIYRILSAHGDHPVDIM